MAESTALDLFNTIILNVGSTSVTKPNTSSDWLTFSPSKNLLDTSVTWLYETISVDAEPLSTVPEYFLSKNLRKTWWLFGQSFKSCKFSFTKKNVQYNVESPYSLEATVSGLSPCTIL